ncbi:MAG TPA: acetylxylan esterase [Verrucomicrobia bacterium]|nr:acetylxylan esterase [Verrucomicrobiota bacterium]HOP98006.1 alpha/beta hydrolase family protein [Verrucomicrobiota bacterium]HPU54908.1 alpha/beta hydrolase family protein [Verrucomicrobiota bacterium]
MKRILWLLCMAVALVQWRIGAAGQADEALRNYFREHALDLSERSLADVNSIEDWTSRRDEHRRQLQRMLGLWPMPERSDLKPVVTGRIEHPEFTVEKLHFQPSPGLFVTANLYVPRNLEEPAPAILYECGHWRLVTNGISYGNKAVYQSDGAWYARNGYVCLVMDTVLAGEIPGIHTGTRDHGLWRWNARGYTPAGVEAWFGIRGLDYLSTRPEVDTNRFGVTGHSGGGAYSWMVTALDDRIKAAAPLAGIADIRTHIVTGVLDSHCDCNFFINYYGWDFPQVAALAAPRPLLIGGTDRDRLFPLETTLRIHEKVQRIYRMYGAADRLGLAIAPGPHDEVPELQLAVMRWFNQHLKGTNALIVGRAERLFDPEQLRVFSELPREARNTNVADWFVPRAPARMRSEEELRSALRDTAFAGWPDGDEPLALERAWSVERDGIRFAAWNFTSQQHVRLRLYVLDRAGGPRTVRARLSVLDAAGWTNWLAAMRPRFGSELREELASSSIPSAENAFEQSRRELEAGDGTLAFMAPRGIGLTAWAGDRRAQSRIRRRFMLLGQTLDGMRVWDIRRAIQAVHDVHEGGGADVELQAERDMAVNALYAALFEPKVRNVRLEGLPESHSEGPDYLGVLTVTDIREVRNAIGSR